MKRSYIVGLITLGLFVVGCQLTNTLGTVLDRTEQPPIEESTTEQAKATDTPSVEEDAASTTAEDTQPASVPSGDVSAADNTETTAEPVTVIDNPNLPGPTLFDHDWDDRDVYRRGIIDSEQDILDDLPTATIYHIDFEINEDMKLLSGKQEIRYINAETEPLNEVFFHLYPNLLGGFSTISNVTVDGSSVEPTYQSQDSAMKVPLAVPLQPGEQVVIGMEFTVSVPTTQDRNYGIFANVNDILALAHFYPLVAAYDHNGWDVETPSPQGDVVYADTSFYIVRVTAPTGQVVVASGIQIDQSQTADTKTLTFAAGPMRDFYLAASNRYAVVSQKVGQTMVNSFYLPDRMARGQEGLKFVLESLKSFNNRYGVYPFTEFDMVPTANLALGIEYPGIVVINEQLYDEEAKLGNGIPSSIFFESTVAHEVAHQWFFSLVGNDQLEEPWVDEALTQYATWRYYFDAYGQVGADGFEQALRARWNRLDNANIPIGKPVSAYDGAEYSSIIYGRGPLFFGALADEIGQDTLDTALQDYALQYRWGIADTEAIKHILEAHCACDLTSLFNEWIYE